MNRNPFPEDAWLENGEELAEYLNFGDDLNFISYLLSHQGPIRWKKITQIVEAFQNKYLDPDDPNHFKEVVSRVLYWMIIRCREQNIEGNILSAMWQSEISKIMMNVLIEGSGIPIHSFRDLFLFFLLKMPGVTMEHGDIVIRDDSISERRRKEALYQAIRMVRLGAGQLPPRPLPRLDMPEDASQEQREDATEDRANEIRAANIPIVKRGVQVEYVERLWSIFTTGIDSRLQTHTHIADYLVNPRQELEELVEDPELRPFLQDEMKSYLEFEKIKGLHYFGKSNKSNKSNKKKKKVSKRK